MLCNVITEVWLLFYMPFHELHAHTQHFRSKYTRKSFGNICHTDKYVDLSCKINSVRYVHYLLMAKSMQQVMQSTQQLGADASRCH